MTEMSKAALDVLSECNRQVEVEGWTPEHDDHHGDGEMAVAAACYALPSRWRSLSAGKPSQALVSKIWPWDAAWWKPKSRRYDLVRAGALIIKEIERLDRQAIRTPRRIGCSDKAMNQLDVMIPGGDQER